MLPDQLTTAIKERPMDTGEWPQFVIEFTDRHTAEQVATEHLRPELADAMACDVITDWSFIRKRPYWRLRYRPADSHARQHLARVLDRLVADGRIIGWTPGIYEPEVTAFGGTAAMDVAHELFHHDSRNILDFLAQPETLDLGRRELAVLLGSVMMRAAGQDWYEQGDVWHRVTQHRPAEHTASPADLSSFRAAMYRLMTVDVSPTRTLADRDPLAAMADWSAAFERAGQQLAELARRGALERGLRAVLTHHVIFFFNRLGLSYAEQHTLSTLAKEVVMTDQHDDASTPATSTGSTNVAAVNTEPANHTTAAERLRNALVDKLHAQGTIRTDRVEAAMRAVPRHLFVPTASLEQAYDDDAVYTKHDGAGVQISAASQPTVVAMMLEQLGVEPGRRILEIGAGTGYNAALLAHLVGKAGHVTTIDVDDDIVDGARSSLSAAGYEHVHVILGDGALGYADGAPYDLVIATVGAWDLPPAWLEQVALGGRVVVPLRLRGSVSRSVVFERDNDGRWRSRSSEMCTFMPLRASIADDARRMIPLTPDGSVILQTNQEQAVDAAAIAGVLDQPRSEAWTGVRFGGAESFEWLYLWLTCTMDNALSRMTVEQPAIDSGLVKPQFGWGTMATVRKGDLAYLTLRPVEKPTDADERTGRLYEVGVIGHGPGGDELTSQVVDQIRTWDQHYRSRGVQFEIQLTDSGESITKTPGHFTFDRPRTRLIISGQ
jgi:protein-L-isoaspartate(D-aspartate) O-methyltransferase